MAIKKSYITVTDQFCGAGGSSQGARLLSKEMNGGVEVALALNHWKLAIETHNTNFPDTLHDCTDISACDPRRYPSTDILITAPECTKHSNADGEKKPKRQIELYNTGKLDPAAERSRATMWDVPRFAEYHRYNYIIVENVVQARNWILFDEWISAMHKLGYNHKCVYHNSMFSWPTPQSRDRMYIHFWKKGNKAPDLNYYPPAFCENCTTDVLAVQSWKDKRRQYGIYGKRGQYVYCCPKCSKVVAPYYYAAINCIDWNIKAERIGDKNLSPNTMRRVNYGYEKYAGKPLLITSRYGTGIESRVRELENNPMPTQPASNAHYLFSPLFVKMEHMASSDSSYVFPGAIRPLSTQTTQMSVNVLMQPFMVNNHSTGLAKDLNSTISTQCTVTKDALVSHEVLNSFFSYYYGGSLQASHVMQAPGTFATKISHALINMPGELPPIEDCTYRMLQPHEVKLGMAFDHDYDIKGNKEEQVKQLGNAVTPPAMKWQLERAIKSLS